MTEEEIIARMREVENLDIPDSSKKAFLANLQAQLDEVRGSSASIPGPAADSPIFLGPRIETDRTGTGDLKNVGIPGISAPSSSPSGPTEGFEPELSIDPLPAGPFLPRIRVREPRISLPAIPSIEL